MFRSSYDRNVSGGPGELFFPQAAFNLIGVSVWAILAVLYLFLLLFAVLNTRPSLIAYGLDAAALAAQVRAVTEELDPRTRWLDQSFTAPTLGIEGIVEAAGVCRVSHVAATRRDQNLTGWTALERALSRRFAVMEVRPNGVGLRWLASGAGLMAVIGYVLYSQTPSIAEGLREMLRV